MIGSLKSPNIAWIVVDSVRSYKGSKDCRELLDVFIESNQEGSRFFNVQTSAPSTIMSTSSMMSGIDSVYHSLTYDGFNAAKNNINYLSNIISNSGYNTYLITFFPEGFKFLGDVFAGLSSRKSSVAPPENRFWNNQEITLVIKDLIDKKLIREPFLLYLNYNCRHDPNTNLEVRNGIKLLKSSFSQRGMYFILNSDHGYPDPSKNLSKSIGVLGHDLVMTEDNITTPLVVTGDGFNPGNRITERVSLLDISELIVSITSNTLTNSKLYKLANGFEINNTIYSTWNRYVAQPGGKVCIVKGGIKYVYDVDKYSGQFSKITSDINEQLEWDINEYQLDDNEYKEYSREIKDIQEYLDGKMLDIELFFTSQLKKKLQLEWKSNYGTTVNLVGEFTDTYIKIVKSLNTEIYKFNCIRRSDLLKKNYFNYKYKNSRRQVFVYVIYGTSLTRWCRELILMFLKGYQISSYTNYNLDKPKNILLLLKYIPNLIYMIIKSVKSWGIINTLRIIARKI